MNLAILLIPALIALAMLNTMSPARVMVRAYIPCLMLFPVYLTVGFGGFLMTDTTLVATILAGFGLFRWYSSLRFTFLDLCVGLLAFSSFYADAHLRGVNIGLYPLCQNLSTCVFPYCIGRTLIEQTGSRRDLTKMLVFCLALVAIASVYEYRMETNIFQETVERIMHQPSAWTRQTRWGFGRIAGPYGHAIIAGMMFSTGLLLHLWLVGTKSWDASKALRHFRASRRAKIMTGILILGLFMTQSRGPWIGCGFGLIIASVGFAKDRRRAVTIAIIVLIIAALATSFGLSSYTAANTYTGTNTGDADQQNAAYRANLYSVYRPLIDEGGLWGWGTPHVMFLGTIGWIKGQTSIDNEYIRMAMAQGYFGIVVFCVILLTSIYKATRLCATLRDRDDVLFAYCLLGSLLTLAFTLTTVSLQDPMTQLAFLIFGWTQSVRPQLNLAPVSIERFAFQRVFA